MVVAVTVVVAVVGGGGGGGTSSLIYRICMWLRISPFILPVIPFRWH